MILKELWSGREIKIDQLNLRLYLIGYFSYQDYLEMIESSGMDKLIDKTNYNNYILYIDSNLYDDLIYSFDDLYENDFIEWEGIKGKKLRITIE